MTHTPDGWVTGDAYESYMGRWSRLLAREFVDWLDPTPLANWLEVGCGTGALTAAICGHAEPAAIVACDPSASFVEHARRSIGDIRVSFVVAGAEALPRRNDGFDVLVSGLVLNFLPDPRAAVASMRERLRPGGTIAAYVWDYADGMEFLRCFWEEAVALDARATHWVPFLRGTGPAPSYVTSLDPMQRESLRERLRRRLHADNDGRIHLRARAWAARGISD
jgi:SAM-dependent methyltransferase